jgi:hypothetical protein
MIRRDDLLEELKHHLRGYEITYINIPLFSSLKYIHNMIVNNVISEDVSNEIELIYLAKYYHIIGKYNKCKHIYNSLIYSSHEDIKAHSHSGLASLYVKGIDIPIDYELSIKYYLTLGAENKNG